MFTGIIQSIGKIQQSESRGGDMRLSIDCPDLDLSNASLGDSVAVNGVCLTLVEFAGQGFAADVSLETLDKTSLGRLATGGSVNLEKALTLNTALGGHLVSGHVDGVARLTEMRSDARSIRYHFEVDAQLQHYIAAKGSVCIDGCSLTVNHVEDNRFEVNIVPHTQQKTVFQFYQVDDLVNIEVDIIARYLERLIQGRAQGSDQKLLKTLIESGFIPK